MVKKEMYQQIQTLKKQGFSRKATARKLSIDPKTVRKYYDMSESNFIAYRKQMMFRDKSFDRFKEDILEVYERNGNKKLNMSAVFDYLEEKHGHLPVSEKSLRNYIHYLVITGALVMNNSVRCYEKVEQMPFGKQAQLDFGQYKMKSGWKAYIFAILLSASRYKYCALQDRPFTTPDVIFHLLDSFDYFGGCIEELAIDQDRLMVVSENKGDILFTKDFDYFIKEMGIKMYVCRAADPESKGKVENLVKYVKYNFFETRDFPTIEEADESLKKWLSRRANGKISQATKQIPAEMLLEERKYLRPLKNSLFRKESCIGREKRTVNDKSYISVSGSNYSVPMRYKNREVEIYLTENELFVFDIFSGSEIAAHALSALPGQKINNKSHFRSTEKSAKELKEEVQALFKLTSWQEFVSHNFKSFPRYVRDQCLDAKKHFSGNIEVEALKKALVFCLLNDTYSFAELNDTYKHFLKETAAPEPEAAVPAPLMDSKKHDEVKVKERELTVYQSLVK